MEIKAWLVFLRVIYPFRDGPWPKDGHSVDIFFIGETDPVPKRLVAWFKVYFL